jgi:putative nucleotidyltransferase with HDIG domain
MIDRPTRRVIALELCALAAAVAVAIARAGEADWDAALFAVLLGLSLVSEFSAIQSATNRVKVAGSFLAIVVATVLVGETPASLIGVLTILVGWAGLRYSRADLLINLVTYAWFPLASGILFHEAVSAFDVTEGDPTFFLLVLAAFVVALLINSGLIAAYSAYIEGSGTWTKFSRMLGPVLPSELASAALAVGIAAAYVELGLATLVLLAAVLLIFQYLIGALLLSQERADELELRAKQLAGFQVALLSALLRTLDLRDRMTARHSAAVARYSREVAAAAGLSEDEQDLVHTAALLHDIGKFILPDRILKGNAELNEADWEQIRKHPEEGARIVSQIDGYRPVGEIIIAHHERFDGLGYPRGLEGDEIPELARIISVCDTYDVMTARDSYRNQFSISSFDATAELRSIAGTQLDPRFVDIFIEVLAGKDVAYRHGEDADFERELALDRRIHDYVAAGDRGAIVGPLHTRS